MARPRSQRGPGRPQQAGGRPLLILLGLGLLGEARAGGGGKWWEEEHEYTYVESGMLIALVIVALAFENIHHHCMHQVESSYRYGNRHNEAWYGQEDDHKDSHGNIEHVQLMHAFTVRTGHEFMTLGFLAFCIFVFRSLHGFEWVARKVPHISGGRHFPANDLDWLHMAEVVHMKLFVGMILYFILVGRISLASVARIKKWEQMRLKRLEARKAGRDLEDARHEEFEEYLKLRNCFVEHHTKEWEKNGIDDFLEKLEIDQCASGKERTRQLQEQIDIRFSFSAYLALNVEDGVRDMILIRKFTWFILLVTFTVIFFLNMFFKVSVLAVSAWFGLLTFGTLVMTWGINHQVKHTIGKDKHGFLSKLTVQLAWHGLLANEWYRTEALWMRVLQVCLNLSSYAFSRVLVDVQRWKEYGEETLTITLVFALLWACLLQGLPQQVPHFLALTALPPYVDNTNLKFFLHVLMDDHITQQTLRAVTPHCRQSGGPIHRRNPPSECSCVSPVSNRTRTLQAVALKDTDALEELARWSDRLAILKGDHEDDEQGNRDIAEISELMGELEARVRTVERRHPWM